MHFWRHVLAFVAILTFASNADILRQEAKLTVGGNANIWKHYQHYIGGNANIWKHC